MPLLPNHQDDQNNIQDRMIYNRTEGIVEQPEPVDDAVEADFEVVTHDTRYLICNTSMMLYIYLVIHVLLQIYLYSSLCIRESLDFYY